MMQRYPALLLLAAVTTVQGQAPIPPPVGTDFNIGVPGIWDIEALGSMGWLWASNVGYGGSGGLIMDCGGCSGYEETTIWSPWLDLNNDPQIDVLFKCAIIGGGMLVPPPIFVRTDGVGGPSYEYRYGFPDLIPPPDEVIPYTNDPFPPLDLGNVEWVVITYPFFAGLNNDSVRIGISTGVPLGGYALVDDIGVGGLPTATASAEPLQPVILRTDDQVTIRTAVPLSQMDLFDTSGRVLVSRELNNVSEVTVPLNGLAASVYFVRLYSQGMLSTFRIPR
ncbi:MAG: T9SS type A sorting domain-containing protein [Flavobacteriales bacterium]|nr:T9SS type A sorting domain-containing protein [Flavobacteriales bacterium]